MSQRTSNSGADEVSPCSPRAPSLKPQGDGTWFDIYPNEDVNGKYRERTEFIMTPTGAFESAVAVRVIGPAWHSDFVGPVRGVWAEQKGRKILRQRKLGGPRRKLFFCP